MGQKHLPNKDSELEYLSTFSPKDKPWDVHKAKSQKIGHLYQHSSMDHYAERIDNCGGYLGFKWVIDSETGELKFKLNAVKFCRVRHCPICQWRRSLMWISRFLKGLPRIVEAYPTARYIFLTLTVRNCKVEDLRQALDEMNEAWHRLIKRKQFPAIGFARSTEVTRATNDMAHPHFHAVLMVKSTYFKGTEYLSQAGWTQLWRSVLKADYDPIVNVKAVKNRHRRKKGQDNTIPQSDSLNASETILDPVQEISTGIVEVFKYTVKPEDLLGTGSEADQKWLVELTAQLRNTRSVSLGGIFKQYISDKEPENLISEDSEDDETNKLSDICFSWREIIEKYVKINM